MFSTSTCRLCFKSYWSAPVFVSTHGPGTQYR